MLTAAALLAFAVPIVSLTPGAVASTDQAVVCAYGYAGSHRKVSYSERDAIYNEYGIPRGTRAGRYRIDHAVPLELGGANDPRNLWPEPVAESFVKDRVESALHASVCFDHTLTLQQAQSAIARDWTRTPVWIPDR